MSIPTAKEVRAAVKEIARQRLEPLGFRSDKEESYLGLVGYSMVSGDEKWVVTFQRSRLASRITARLARCSSSARRAASVDWLVLSQGGTWTRVGDFIPFASMDELREALSELVGIVESLGMKWFRREIEFDTWMEHLHDKER